MQTPLKLYTTPLYGWSVKSGQEMDYELKTQIRYADTYVGA